MANWDKAVWFITGTSSGFGHEIATAVIARGGRVAATARQVQTLQSLVQLAPDRVLALPLDVVNRKQIAAAAQRAEQHFGAIDVLVNNAGYGLIGTIEHMPEADIRQLFEVNFFGLVAMTQAVLPGMRRQRRGFIVNISSGAGLGGHAGSAYYCASKFAVEGFTESLRAEVKPLGIGAIAVEPGFFKTEFGHNAQKPAQIIPDYEPTAGLTAKMMASMKGREPGDPARAASIILDTLNESDPPGQLVLGASSHQGVTARLADRLSNIQARRPQAVGADFPAS